MKEILISINPEFVEKIFSGEKTYEFRKVICKQKPEKLIIYCTSPVCAVVGEAQIESIIVDNPVSLWQKTKEEAGVEEKFFFEYFEQKDTAIAYKLTNVIKYDKLKKLSFYGVNYAPQSFIYL